MRFDKVCKVIYTAEKLREIEARIICAGSIE